MMMKSFFLVLVIGLITFPAVADEKKARIVTSVNRPVDCMFSVDVYNINGERVNKTPLAFNIEPGKHIIKARSTADLSLCRPTISNARTVSIPPLEIEVEAGKSYFIAYNVSSNNRREWKLEVWKVE